MPRSAGDSWSVEGLRAAGLAVRQSPLLFQGGNLLAFRRRPDVPAELLVGSVEIHRNRGLGLSEEEILQAFAGEFGVARVHVIPSWSFHLDLDMTLRTTPGDPVAFVGDPAPAAAILRDAVHSRLTELRPPGVTPPEDDSPAGWHAWFRRHTTPGQPPGPDLRPVFQREPTEDPGLNANLLLTALDVLEALDGSSPPGPKVLALRSLLAAREAQQMAVERAGFRRVPVPALPDLIRVAGSINALGFRTRMAIPVWGGLFEELDRAAMEVYRRELPPEVVLVPIRCTGSLRFHGGVRCTAQALPALRPAR